MSNKTQLQTNNSSLDALIARVNAAKETAASLPDAGSGSGGSVETCTVTFTIKRFGGISGVFDIVYTTYENGTVSSRCDRITSNKIYTEFSLSNVVCSSSITLVDESGDLYGDALINGTAAMVAQALIYRAFSAPSVAGEICTIQIV